ncbi:MAG: hypothetical protein ACRCZF_04845, partial [Gemmataceae bacterium]
MNRIVTILLLGLLVGPAPAQDAAPAIVQKAIDAHGGAAAMNKSKIAKSKTKGTMAMYGVGDVDFVSSAVYALPEKFKLEMAAEVKGLKMTAVQMLNGKTVKVESTYAGTKSTPDDKAKDETFQAVLLQEVTTLTPLVETKKYTLKAEKDDTVDGKAAAVVAVTGNGLRGEVKLFFDKANGQLLKTERKGLASAEKGIIEV